MNPQSQRITADQLIRMSSPGKRFELRKGELVVMVPSGAQHGQVTLRIGRLLAEHVEEHQLGTVFGAETRFRLERDPDTVLVPEVAPDLVVEVISPSDSAAELGRKTRAWLDFGVKVVWVVDPQARTVCVWTHDAPERTFSVAESLDGGPALLAFRRSLRDFFP